MNRLLDKCSVGGGIRVRLSRTLTPALVCIYGRAMDPRVELEGAKTLRESLQDLTSSPSSPSGLQRGTQNPPAGGDRLSGGSRCVCAWPLSSQAPAAQTGI